MLWRDVATLVTIESELDDDGYPKETETRREVFADVQSARRSEFYAARQTGTAINIVFLVRAVDYKDETRIEYIRPGDDEASVYSVIRAHTKGGEIYELNCALESSPGSVVRRRTQ